MNKNAFHIAIFGTGAMASLFGALLDRQTGNKIRLTLIGSWKEQIKAVQKNGLTVWHLDGKKTSHKLNITDNLAEVPPVDMALILVKSYQSKKVADQLKRILKPDGFVVTLQNGLGHQWILAEQIGKKRIVSGTTYVGATMIEPGIVRNAGIGLTYIEVVNGFKKELRYIRHIFMMAGIKTILVPDIESIIWGKLVMNAAINPLTALYEVPNGQLIKDENIKKVMFQVVQEAAYVAEALYIELPYPNAIEQVQKICRNSENNHSSMYQDIKRGAQTEIDAITGKLIEIAKQEELDTLYMNERVYAAIKQKEAGQLSLV